ncbi:leucine-, isoleucine-, valine-, threonine-, and alanine-binding protein precursor [Variibacter gotjawalensis]|uniref:Leucine-, isoleucine-, valine-, threonine-, and alanine-binding protein n=1 Tax=Variibacter gotjawalensis TaxID=1333996 RepID=A0A0S3PNG8_9BRAD|nr:ABC transporter substrate-binding protein [Variibacter gotjawalensis]NIK47780.1 branched-chain amino acid transport system substrate-binding protein [Variibacter gotjawalensis]RZS49667.1 amino acid/amide ABC transporter substrate-binding protein (HAAT family) [Variibacter gotjawalensis]BAT57496.1 leucine-, isoleucine-, valine-, threonine-, and alanine-binding protein precursor [Variibacter gotjawalensis]
MKRTTKWLAGLAAAVLSSSIAFAQNAPIKIGAVLSATGPASFLGDPEKKTLEMYVAEINAKGGINGQQIKLFVYDDGGDPNQARSFATRLLEEDKVDALLAGSTTATTMAIIPLAEENQVPLINFAGAVQAVFPAKKWNFKTPHTDLMACEKIFEDLKKRSLTKIAMISGTDAFGKSMRDQCMTVNQKYGIEVLHEETYGPRDSDMTPQLTNIKSKAGVQAVVNPGFGQGPAIVTRNYRQLAVPHPLYQSHGVGSKEFIQLAGPAAEGVRLPAAALLVAEKLPDNDPQKKVVVDYKKMYEAKTGQPVSTFGGHMYDGLMILVEAIGRAKSVDKAKVRDEIEKTKGLIGTGGVVNMSPTDHLGLDLTAFRMLEIKNGDWTLMQ